MADALLPPTFCGKSCENGQTWLQHFENYCTLKKLNEAQQIATFGLLFREKASTWFQSLNDDTKASMQNIKDSFSKSYTDSKFLFQKERNLFLEKQEDDEPVRDFVARVNTKAKTLNLEEPQIVRILLGGLCANISAHVIKNDPTTVEELLDLATMAEKTNPPSASAEILKQLSVLSKTVESLSVKKDDIPAVNKVTKPEQVQATETRHSFNQPPPGCFPPCGMHL